MNLRLNFHQASPGAMQALRNLDAPIQASSLEKPLIELVRLRASQINGCAYCVDAHSRDARRAGDSERRLNAVIVWRETPFFSARERAALEWTEALTRVAETHVPDAAWEAVRAQFSDAEIVDLSVLIGAINAWNRIGVAFRKLPV